MVLQISEAGAIYDGVTVVFAHTLSPEEQGTTTLIEVFRLAIVNDVGTFLKKYAAASLLNQVAMTKYYDTVALHGTYMFVLTCSFTVRSVCFRTSPVNAYVRISIEIRLEHSYSS
jgi:hypothetical protein